MKHYFADGQPLIPPGQAGAEVFNCPDDYIVINGIRLCGEGSMMHQCNLISQEIRQ